MNTGWNPYSNISTSLTIINLLGNEYWLEHAWLLATHFDDYKPTGK